MESWGARVRPAQDQARVIGTPAVLVRLQKYLAEAGIASRRRCEQLIEDGRVSVNGQAVRVLPLLVDPVRRLRDFVVGGIGRELEREAVR